MHANTQKQPAFSLKGSACRCLTAAAAILHFKVNNNINVCTGHMQLRKTYQITLDYLVLNSANMVSLKMTLHGRQMNCAMQQDATGIYM